MELYYCKTLEDFESIITQSELYQGATLDNASAYYGSSDSGDVNVVLERLRTAQAEVEQILCNRFVISRVRTSEAEFLRYATAIIAWWHLEINGEGRELIKAKYLQVIKELSELTAIVAGDGSTISTAVDAGLPGAPPRKSRVLGGKRSSYLEGIKR